MSVIKFDVRVSTHNVGGLDPDDVWSRDSTEGSVDVVGARLEAKDGYDCLFTDKEVAPGATVWLVWAEYTTGDSFGSDGGNYDPADPAGSLGGALAALSVANIKISDGSTGIPPMPGLPSIPFMPPIMFCIMDMASPVLLAPGKAIFIICSLQYWL